MKKQRVETVGERIRFRDELQEETGRRLMALADSFKMLAGGFSHFANKKAGPDRSDYNLVVDNLCSYLCSDCACCEICWNERYEESCEFTYRLIESEQVLPEMVTHCVNPDGFVQELNRSLDYIGSRILWRNMLTESRESAAVQLIEISRILTEFSGEINRPGEVMELRKWIIASRLRTMGIRAKKIYLFRRPKRGLELQITARCKDGSIAVKKVASEIGKVIDRCLVPGVDCRRVIDREYAQYRFCEDVNYKTLTGVARKAAGKNEVSGDSFSFMYPDSGDMLMLLSDGMGSGERAGRESGFAIEFLEKLLETGFREENAVRLLNSALVMHDENTMFSTVDIAALNLYTGMCSFVKLGAAVTLVKRGTGVETVCSEELPAGVVNDIDCKSQRKKMFDGDYIIMLSDGVTEQVPSELREGFFCELISNLSCCSPQEMADSILDAVAESSSGEARDDMTVLVSGVWKKR